MMKKIKKNYKMTIAYDGGGYKAVSYTHLAGQHTVEIRHIGII